MNYWGKGKGMQHRDVCSGPGCNHCETCGDHRFSAEGVCMVCYPMGSKETKPKSRTPRVSNKSIRAAREADLYNKGRLAE